MRSPSQPQQPQAPQAITSPTGPTTHRTRLDVLVKLHAMARDACEGLFVCLIPGERHPRVFVCADEHAAYNQLREETVDIYRDAWAAAEGWDIPTGWAMLQIQ
tara:strand:+ start:325 stop:633 length:309 start_codon:yes stop_codon:yes gene_type:complete